VQMWGGGGGGGYGDSNGESVRYPAGGGGSGAFGALGSHSGLFPVFYFLFFLLSFPLNFCFL
jgi:hypothetical protein